MKKTKFQKVLQRVVDVKTSEVVPTLLLFSYFFLLTSSVYIIKPVKISLYLHWLTFEKLPYVYFLTALFMGFAVSFNSRLLQSLKREHYIIFSLIFFASNCVIFWIFFKFQWPWLSMIFWFWADIFAATSITQFWIFTNEIYTARQAKRLVGFLVSGGLLGGISGSLIATRLAAVLGTENLLLLCPAMLGITTFVVLSIRKYRPAEEGSKIIKTARKTGYLESFRIFKKNRHLIFLGGIVAATLVVTTLIDFQFNSIIEHRFANKDSRTAFLGTFFICLLVFSYFFHVLMTNRILKNLGIRIALLITPFVLLVGSGAIFFVPSLYMVYWATALKGADKGLAHSLSQSVKELLYIPVPPEIKSKAKVFIDMFLNKLAKGFGAILLILFFSILHFSVAQISLVVIFFTIIWIVFSWRITQEYVNIIKKKLRVKWQDADKIIMENIDVDFTKLVFDTLQSRQKSSVLYAMNLFDLIKKEKMSPQFKKITQGKSRTIQASSMDSLLELDGEQIFPEMEDVLEEEDLDVKIKEIMSLNVYQELIKDNIVKIMQRKDEGAEVSKMEVAKAFGMMDPSSPAISHLTKLLKDSSPEVTMYALESADKLQQREFVPFIVPHLSLPPNQEKAIKVLAGYGEKIAGTLKDYLGDPEENIQIRKRIPEILSRIATQKAADFLIWELNNQREEVKNEIIESMYKMKLRNPLISFPEKHIHAEIMRKIKLGYQTLMGNQDFNQTTEKSTLHQNSERKFSRTIKHIFELLSLIYPEGDIMQAYQNICSETKESLDYSLELLDNRLKKQIKESLFPLIEDIPYEDKVKKGKKILKSLDKRSDST